MRKYTNTAGHNNRGGNEYKYQNNMAKGSMLKAIHTSNKSRRQRPSNLTGEGPAGGHLFSTMSSPRPCMEAGDYLFDGYERNQAT